MATTPTRNYGYLKGAITVEQMNEELSKDKRTKKCTLTYYPACRQFTIENSAGLSEDIIREIFKRVKEKSSCFPMLLPKRDPSGNLKVSLCPFWPGNGTIGNYRPCLKDIN